MAKEKDADHINNVTVDEVFETLRQTFTNELLKHQGMTFEEMDIVLYRLQESVFQSKLDLYIRWKNENTSDQPNTVPPKGIYH